MKRLLLLTGFVMLLSPCSAWAHALGAQWEIKGGKVELEAFFSDDTPAQAAQVMLFNELDRQKRLVEVKTDEKGACSFPRPGPGKYIIVVDAGGGHRKEFHMEILARPEMINGITLVWGSASLGDFGNLSLFPIIAQEDEVRGTRGLMCGTRDEFTAYPWVSVMVGLGSIAVIALFFWAISRPR